MIYTLFQISYCNTILSVPLFFVSNAIRFVNLNRLISLIKNYNKHSISHGEGVVLKRKNRVICKTYTKSIFILPILPGVV
jgi:hypothetical protein